jgi:hypothetical protein
MDLNLLDRFITITGKRNSGKSELAKYLFSKWKGKYDQHFIISATDFSHFWNSVTQAKNIFSDYDEGWVTRLMEKMKEENEGKTRKSHGFKRVLLILDDVMASNTGHRLKSLESLAQKGRHYGIDVWVICQWYLKVSPAQRNNTDILFYGKNSRASNELLESEANNGSLSRQEFMSMIQRNTDDYHFLVINNNSSNTSDLKKTYGKFKVPDIE